MPRLTHNLLSPLSDVGCDLDRMFSSVLERNFARPVAGKSDSNWLPALDISEAGDVYQIEAELPGFQLDDIDVTIEGRKIVISGQKETGQAETEMKEAAADADEQSAATEERIFHRRERRFGSFSRTITVPVHVDATQAEAEISHGVLTLRVPKAEAARQHKVEIRGN